MINVPAATLLYDGRAVYFDENDEQLTDLQDKGWKGLHEFLEKYPEAEVHLTLGKNRGLRKLDERSINGILDKVKDSRNEEMKTGERYMKSYITGQLYRVTKWREVEGSEDKIIAEEKEPVDAEILDQTGKES